jgi:MoaA/NifB/PqqE/SkfB family radical SAM enzyme
MSYDTLASILDQPLPSSLDITLSGWGEPLLHPRIFDMIKLINAYGFRSHITTNGTLLTRDKINSLIESGLNSICISIDAFQASTLAKLRPGSQNYDIFGNTKKLVEENRKRGKKLEIGLSYTLNGYNVNELKEFLNWGFLIGVDWIYVTELIFKYLGVRKSPPRITKKQHQRIYRQIFRHASRTITIFNKILVRAPPLKYLTLKIGRSIYKSIQIPRIILETSHFEHPCVLLKESLFISADKKVYPCCHFAIYGENCLSNEPYSLIDVWKGNKLHKLRENHLSQKLCKLCHQTRGLTQILFLKRGKAPYAD